MSRRLIVIICVCLVCAVMLCSCSSSDTDKDGVKVPVYADDGTLTGYERSFHNDKGQLSRLDQFSADDEYTGFILYDYDSDGRIFQETTYGPDGIGKFFYNYEYDDEGRYYRVSYVTMNDGYTVTWYKDGEENEIYNYASDGTVLSHKALSNGEWIDATEEPLVPASQPQTAAESDSSDES